LSCFKQAVLVIRWLPGATRVRRCPLIRRPERSTRRPPGPGWLRQPTSQVKFCGGSCGLPGERTPGRARIEIAIGNAAIDDAAGPGAVDTARGQLYVLAGWLALYEVVISQTVG